MQDKHRYSSEAISAGKQRHQTLLLIEVKLSGAKRQALNEDHMQKANFLLFSFQIKEVCKPSIRQNKPNLEWSGNAETDRGPAVTWWGHVTSHNVDNLAVVCTILSQVVHDRAAAPLLSLHPQISTTFHLGDHQPWRKLCTCNKKIFSFLSK